MRVALHKTGERIRMLLAARTSTARGSRLPAVARSLGIDAVPRRHEHGREAPVEASLEARCCPPRARRSTCSQRPVRAKLPVARTRRCMVAGGHSHAGRSSPRGVREPASARLSSMSAGITASAMGTLRAICDFEQAGRARANRGRRRRRGTRDRRCRPAARQASSSSSRRLPSAHWAIRHWTIPLRSVRAPRGVQRRSRHCAPRHRCRSSTCPSARGVPAESTAAARMSGSTGAIVDDDPRGRSRARRTPRARCSVSPLPVNGTTTGSRAARDDVEHRVVSALRHRHERPPQAAPRKSTRAAFDDGRWARLRAVKPLPCRRSGMFGPASTRQVRWPNRDFGCAARRQRQQFDADTASTRRDHNFLPARHPRLSQAGRPASARSPCNAPAARARAAAETSPRIARSAGSPCTRIASNQVFAQPSISRSRSSFVLHLQNLAHRADHERPRTRRLDPLEQRHELEAQRPSPERERFEDDGIGLHGIVASRAAGRAATCDRRRRWERKFAVAQRHEARVGDPDRRQLDDADAAGHAPADRHSAGHEVHVATRSPQAPRR